MGLRNAIRLGFEIIASSTVPFEIKNKQTKYVSIWKIY